jgi:hypothetical protein
MVTSSKYLPGFNGEKEKIFHVVSVFRLPLSSNSLKKTFQLKDKFSLVLSIYLTVVLTLIFFKPSI